MSVSYCRGGRERERQNVINDSFSRSNLWQQKQNERRKSWAIHGGGGGASTSATGCGIIKTGASASARCQGQWSGPCKVIFVELNVRMNNSGQRPRRQKLARDSLTTNVTFTHDSVHSDPLPVAYRTPPRHSCE